MTLFWHVYDLKVSHEDPEVVTAMVEWFRACFSGDDIGDMKVTRGKTLFPWNVFRLHCPWKG